VAGQPGDPDRSGKLEEGLIAGTLPFFGVTGREALALASWPTSRSTFLIARQTMATAESAASEASAASVAIVARRDLLDLLELQVGAGFSNSPA
jgi:hypothetical protein